MRIPPTVVAPPAAAGAPASMPAAHPSAASVPTAASRPDPTQPPAAPRDDTVVDEYAGTRVADPFRPLESIDAPATVAWWKANNQRTDSFLAGAAEARAAATKWHTDIRNYTRESMASVAGDTSFFTRQSGLESQPTYYVRDTSTPGAPDRVLLDPKTLSADGTVHVASMDPSPDGTIAAYTVSASGSDWQTMRFRDTRTGEDLGTELTGLRFTNATWDPDGKGVLYNKPLPPDQSVDGKAFGLYHHTLGTPQSADTLVLSRPDMRNSFVGAERLQPDDPYTLIFSGSGTDPAQGLAVQRPGSAQPVTVLEPGIASVDPFHRDGDTLFAVTDKDAPRNRIVAIDLNDPAPERWRTVVAESTEPGAQLLWGVPSGGKFVVGWSKGGADAMEVRSTDGAKLADVPLPVASKVQLGDVKPNASSFELSVGGFLSPGTRYRYDVASNQLSFVKKSDIPRDLTQIAEVERITAPSADGTRVPAWVVKPKGLQLDGTTPTLLYSYGGFNSPVDPHFSLQAAHWVEQGGVYVVANLRGGGEFGKEWYDGGRLQNKQNTFDDLAGVAKELFRRGITSPKRLAINGGSNGGLTTAAASQQHPELYGAVISEVPVTDMLRFPTDNYGASWMSDYGDPHDPEDFAASIKYSPVHNVRSAREVQYPPTLIMTGDHDDRVGPWHAFKWAATRHAAGQTDNTFLRVSEQAGHGAGKPTKKLIEEAADRYAFLTQTVGTPTPPQRTA